MSNLITHEIYEQRAIFDGKPDFIDGSLVINVLNHNALGSSKNDLAEIKRSPEDYPAINPRRYRVVLTVQYEDITDI